MNIFLDNDRKHRSTPPSHYRFDNAEDLIMFFKEHPHLSINFISFDNDLGHRLEGYDVVKYMVDNHIIAKHYNIHSGNVIAKYHMVSYLTSAMQSRKIPTARVTRDDLTHYQKRFKNQ